MPYIQSLKSHVRSLGNDYNNLINTKQENGSIIIDPNKHILLRKIEAISIIIFNELDQLFVKKLHFCTSKQKLIVAILEYNNMCKNDDVNQLEHKKYFINVGLIEKPKEGKDSIAEEEEKSINDETKKEVLEYLIITSILKNHIRAIQTIFAANSQLFNDRTKLNMITDAIKFPFVISNATKTFCNNMLKWNKDIPEPPANIATFGDQQRKTHSDCVGCATSSKAPGLNNSLQSSEAKQNNNYSGIFVTDRSVIEKDDYEIFVPGNEYKFGEPTKLL